MILLSILLSIALVGFLCWLLFTLAIFALPVFAGVVAGSWAWHTGAGWLGALAIGLIVAGLILGFGQILLTTVQPMWARLPISLAFVAPASFAGYHAVHGIVQHAVPSEPWQIVFSVIGATAIGIVAFARVTGIAPAGPSERRAAQASSSPLERAMAPR